MALHGLTLFCLTYFLATATPGPGIGAILARVLGRGTEGLVAFIAGYVVGDLIWFTLAATGMAMLAQTAHSLFVVIKYAGAAYLLYLAYRLWMVPVEVVGEGKAPPPQCGPRVFIASLTLTLTLGNPKVMIFFLALLPTVLDLTKMSLPAFMEVAAAICLILTSVLSIYAGAAIRARRLFKSVHAVRWLNRGTGTVMAGAAIAVATR
jgi:threonine/homoserine/homoserine lactone efflux protein